MGIVKFNISNIKDVQAKVNSNNTQILEIIKQLSSELENIETILSTPKSRTYIPKYLEYFKSEEKYLTSAIAGYDTKFNSIINEYNNYVSNIKEMVGGQNAGK